MNVVPNGGADMSGVLLSRETLQAWLRCAGLAAEAAGGGTYYEAVLDLIALLQADLARAEGAANAQPQRRDVLEKAIGWIGAQVESPSCIDPATGMVLVKELGEVFGDAPTVDPEWPHEFVREISGAFVLCRECTQGPDFCTMGTTARHRVLGEEGEQDEPIGCSCGRKQQPPSGGQSACADDQEDYAVPCWCWSCKHRERWAEVDPCSTCLRLTASGKFYVYWEPAEDADEPPSGGEEGGDRDGGATPGRSERGGEEAPDVTSASSDAAAGEAETPTQEGGDCLWR